MVIYLYGPDTFRSRQYRNQTIEKFKRDRDPRGYNVVALEAPEVSAEKILNELTAAPFLAERRLLVLKNILTSTDEALLEALAARLKNQTVPSSTALLVWQAETPSKNAAAKKLGKLLAAEKYALEFTPLTGVRLRQWIEGELAARGATAPPPVVEWLGKNFGADLFALNGLLDQLAAYAAGRVITLADIQIFASESNDDTVFALAEAIARKETGRAYALLALKRQQGEADGKIFGLIVWQFRILLELADLLERDAKLTSETAAKKLGLHPYVAKKNWALAKQYPLNKLENTYRALVDLDTKTKTGVAPQSLLIDLFIAKI